MMRLHEKYGVPRISFEQFYSNVQASAARWFAFIGYPGNTPRDDNMIQADYTVAFNQVVSEGFHPQPYDDIREAFFRLHARGIPAAVVSSHPASNLEREAEAYGVRGCIHTIVGDAKDKAPHIAAIADRFGVPRSNVLYVGDTTFDIIAGRRAEVLTGAMAGPADKQRGYHTRALLGTESPDFMLESLLDLVEPETLARRAYRPLLQ